MWKQFVALQTGIEARSITIILLEGIILIFLPQLLSIAGCATMSCVKEGPSTGMPKAFHYTHLLVRNASRQLACDDQCGACCTTGMPRAAQARKT